jgi:hypothetical protein
MNVGAAKCRITANSSSVVGVGAVANFGPVRVVSSAVSDELVRRFSYNFRAAANSGVYCSRTGSAAVATANGSADGRTLHFDLNAKIVESGSLTSIGSPTVRGPIF